MDGTLGHFYILISNFLKNKKGEKGKKGE